MPPVNISTLRRILPFQFEQEEDPARKLRILDALNWADGVDNRPYQQIEAGLTGDSYIGPQELLSRLDYQLDYLSNPQNRQAILQAQTLENLEQVTNNSRTQFLFRQMARADQNGDPEAITANEYDALMRSLRDMRYALQEDDELTGEELLAGMGDRLQFLTNPETQQIVFSSGPDSSRTSVEALVAMGSLPPQLLLMFQQMSMVNGNPEDQYEITQEEYLSYTQALAMDMAFLQGDPDPGLDPYRHLARQLDALRTYVYPERFMADADNRWALNRSFDVNFLKNLDESDLERISRNLDRYRRERQGETVEGEVDQDQMNRDLIVADLLQLVQVSLTDFHHPEVQARDWSVHVSNLQALRSQLPQEYSRGLPPLLESFADYRARAFYLREIFNGQADSVRSDHSNDVNIQPLEAVGADYERHPQSFRYLQAAGADGFMSEADARLALDREALLVRTPEMTTQSYLDSVSRHVATRTEFNPLGHLDGDGSLVDAHERNQLVLHDLALMLHGFTHSDNRLIETDPMSNMATMLTYVFGNLNPLSAGLVHLVKAEVFDLENPEVREDDIMGNYLPLLNHTYLHYAREGAESSHTHRSESAAFLTRLIGYDWDPTPVREGPIPGASSNPSQILAGENDEEGNSPIGSIQIAPMENFRTVREEGGSTNTRPIPPNRHFIAWLQDRNVERADYFLETEVDEQDLRTYLAYHRSGEAEQIEQIPPELRDYVAFRAVLGDNDTFHEGDVWRYLETQDPEFRSQINVGNAMEYMRTYGEEFQARINRIVQTELSREDLQRYGEMYSDQGHPERYWQIPREYREYVAVALHYNGTAEGGLREGEQWREITPARVRDYFYVTGNQHFGMAERPDIVQRHYDVLHGPLFRADELWRMRNLTDRDESEQAWFNFAQHLREGVWSFYGARPFHNPLMYWNRPDGVRPTDREAIHPFLDWVETTTLGWGLFDMFTDDGYWTRQPRASAQWWYVDNPNFARSILNGIYNQSSDPERRYLARYVQNDSLGNDIVDRNNETIQEGPGEFGLNPLIWFDNYPDEESPLAVSNLILLLPYFKGAQGAWRLAQGARTAIRSQGLIRAVATFLGLRLTSNPTAGAEGAAATGSFFSRLYQYIQRTGPRAVDEVAENLPRPGRVQRAWQWTKGLFSSGADDAARTVGSAQAPKPWYRRVVKFLWDGTGYILNPVNWVRGPANLLKWMGGRLSNFYANSPRLQSFFQSRFFQASPRVPQFIQRWATRPTVTASRVPSLAEGGNALTRFLGRWTGPVENALATRVAPLVERLPLGRNLVNATRGTYQFLKEGAHWTVTRPQFLRNQGRALVGNLKRNVGRFAEVGLENLSVAGVAQGLWNGGRAILNVENIISYFISMGLIEGTQDVMGDEDPGWVDREYNLNLPANSTGDEGTESNEETDDDSTGFQFQSRPDAGANDDSDSESEGGS